MTRSGARERILGRIAGALEGREVVGHPGPPPCGPHPASGTGSDSDPAASGGPDATAALDAFTDAFRRAGGEVAVLGSPDAAGRWLGDFATDFAAAAVAADVPDGLRPPLPGADAADAALGVSMALGAAADTGTLLLGSRTGRRPQLLPPTHLVWVDRATLHPTLGGAMDRVREGGIPATLALHSGPSRSADIGRIVVTGVHGPGRVVAAIVTFGTR